MELFILAALVGATVGTISGIFLIKAGLADKFVDWLDKPWIK